jgi:hypothetical protein
MTFSIAGVRRTLAFASAAALVLCTFSAPDAAATARRSAPRFISRPVGIERFVQRYVSTELDPREVSARVASGDTVRIPTAIGELAIALEPHEIRSSRYRATATGEGGVVTELERGPLRTFAGTVTERPGASARFTITNEEVIGLVLLEDTMYFVEPASRFVLEAGPTDYIVYDMADVVETEPGTCGVSAAERFAKGADFVSKTAAGVVGTSQRFDIATEADFEYVNALGGATNATNEIITILNQVDGVYQAEVGLTLSIVFQNVWTTSSDPYSSTDASTVLNEFRSHWSTSMSGVARDLAHMWTGKDMNGSTIGIAWVGVVCANASFSYGVSQRWTTQPQKFVLTAHEIGHNFDADHSDGQSGCPNTIMHSSVGTGLTFCQFSRNQINAWTANNSSCLATAGPTTTVGVYNPATGAFFLRNSNTPGIADTTLIYGSPGATPIAGDWDGNGTTTVGIYVPSSGSFFLRNSNSPGPADLSFSFGAPGATPVVGDWDGNGTTTVGIYVPSSGTFFLKNTHTAGPASVTLAFGAAGGGFLPIAGDWDGDGDDTIGIYNPATGAFFLRNTNASGPADLTIIYGPPGARPLAGDWTGRGNDTVGIYVAATGAFFLRNSNSPGPADTTCQFGPPALTPLVGDWNGL